jgi:nucleotide-binding universal stress UspA family protein
MFKKILVPIDVTQSDSGVAGLKAAADLGAKSGAELVLLNVISPVPNMVAAQLPGNYLDSAQENASKVMDEMASKVGLKSGSYEIRTAQGGAYAEILSVADSSGADLIVVASHQPGLSDYLLGSTAAKIVRHAKISVLVVRD